jgi:hypothetical protein
VAELGPANAERTAAEVRGLVTEEHWDAVMSPDGISLATARRRGPYGIL